MPRILSRAANIAAALVARALPPIEAAAHGEPGAAAGVVEAAQRVPLAVAVRDGRAWPGASGATALALGFALSTSVCRGVVEQCPKNHSGIQGGHARREPETHRVGPRFASWPSI